MPSTASFIRNAEAQLRENRKLNLNHLNEEYGHGFQAMLVGLMREAGRYISPTEVSNLANGSGTDFTDERARRLEKALDLPRGVLDVPDWHFRENLPFFWEYAVRAADDRDWFDDLLLRLLEVPLKEPHESSRIIVGGKRIDLKAIRERLQKKAAE